MPSKARAAFDKNAEDITRLLEIHENLSGNGPGRRHRLEVLNKSAIVLLTAVWEAYCEDIATEALSHMVTHSKNANALPLALKKQIAAELKKEQHELAIWELSDDGWKTVLRKRFDHMAAKRNKTLNTPKTRQIEDHFRDSIGLDGISNHWKWAKKMTTRRASTKLDKLVELRGQIAHRGANSTSVTKAHVVGYFEFIKRLTGKTGGAVNTHVKTTTGKPLW